MTSHKQLKSISHNFGHSFISLMNYVNDDYFLGHLLKQARKTTLNKLTIDVLQNSAKPTELLTHEIKTSIEHWNNRFPLFVENSGSTMDFIRSAILTVDFDLNQTRPHLNDNQIVESPFICVFEIIDDRGKVYKNKHEGWWYPET